MSRHESPFAALRGNTRPIIPLRANELLDWLAAIGPESVGKHLLGPAAQLGYKGINRDLKTPDGQVWATALHFYVGERPSTPPPHAPNTVILFSGMEDRATARIVMYSTVTDHTAVQELFKNFKEACLSLQAPSR